MVLSSEISTHDFLAETILKEPVLWYLIEILAFGNEVLCQSDERATMQSNMTVITSDWHLGAANLLKIMLVRFPDG